MSSMSPRARSLLDAARSDGPSTVDRDRIASQLAARLAAGHAPSADPATAAPPAGPGAAATPPAGTCSTASSVATSSSVGVMAASALGVLLLAGVLLVRTTPSGAPGTPPTGGDGPAPSEVTAPVATTQEHTPHQAAPATTIERDLAADDAPGPQASAAIGPGAPSSLVVARAPADRSSPPTSHPARSPHARSAPASLAEELALMRAAREASRGDDPARALRLLDELDRRHPDGALHEERTAARVIARCAAGDPSARDEAARFLRQMPSSIHAARVRAACAGAEER